MGSWLSSSSGRWSWTGQRRGEGKRRVGRGRATDETSLAGRAREARGGQEDEVSRTGVVSASRVRVQGRSSNAHNAPRPPQARRVSSPNHSIVVMPTNYSKCSSKLGRIPIREKRMPIFLASSPLTTLFPTLSSLRASRIVTTFPRLPNRPTRPATCR